MNNLKKLATALMVGVVALGSSAMLNAKNADVNRNLVNPQWFTYNLDPTAANFSTQKLVASNYTATGVTTPGTDVCPGLSNFCAVFAQTVSGKPDLSAGQPANTALTAYTNGAGQTSGSINEQN
jgi:hypothetical protein